MGLGGKYCGKAGNCQRRVSRLDIVAIPLHCRHGRALRLVIGARYENAASYILYIFRLPSSSSLASSMARAWDF
jgi:hypothetical protein